MAEPAPGTPALETVRLTVNELRATQNSDCLAVHFADADAEVRPVVTGDSGSLSESKMPGLCGFEFAIEVPDEARYVALTLMEHTGRSVKSEPVPLALRGGVAFSGRESWSIQLPRRLNEAFEYRLIALASHEPLTDTADWLMGQPDTAAALAKLARDGVTILRHDHRVVP